MKSGQRAPTHHRPKKSERKVLSSWLDEPDESDEELNPFVKRALNASSEGTSVTPEEKIDAMKQVQSNAMKRRSPEREAAVAARQLKFLQRRMFVSAEVISIPLPTTQQSSSLPSVRHP